MYSGKFGMKHSEYEYEQNCSLLNLSAAVEIYSFKTLFFPTKQLLKLCFFIEIYRHKWLTCDKRTTSVFWMFYVKNKNTTRSQNFKISMHEKKVCVSLLCPTWQMRGHTFFLLTFSSLSAFDSDGVFDSGTGRDDDALRPFLCLPANGPQQGSTQNHWGGTCVIVLNPHSYLTALITATLIFPLLN